MSYAWGKVREHDALKIFNPGSTHNFIPHELALKLGIHEFEMGDHILADGAFKGQDVSFTPLIGKLHVHIQGYTDKEDFYISPLKHEDVILGASWFDCIQAHMKFPERKVLFTFRGKEYALGCNVVGNTILVVVSFIFLKVIKNYISCYIVFIKDHDKTLSELDVSKGKTKEELEMSNLLREF